MKILILSLLFLAGTQGSFPWQNDEPAKEAPEEDTKLYSTFVDDIVHLGSEVFDYLEASDKDKEKKIAKRIEALKHDGEKIKKDIEKSLDDAWKEMETDLNQKYPVFMGKVVPLLEDFNKRWTKHVFKVKKDASVVVHNLFTGLKTQINDFLENIHPVLEKGHDKIREEVEALRVKITPLKDEIHEEIQKNRKEAQAELEKYNKEFRETVDKELEDLHQAIKPYLKTIQENSEAEDVKGYLNKLLNELKNVFYTDQSQP